MVFKRTIIAIASIHSYTYIHQLNSEYFVVEIHHGDFHFTSKTHTKTLHTVHRVSALISTKYTLKSAKSDAVL